MASIDHKTCLITSDTKYLKTVTLELNKRNNREINDNTVHVDWNDLLLKATVQEIRVSDCYSQKNDLKRTLLQLAIAIQSHPTNTISKIVFEGCHLEELGHLLMAAMKHHHGQLRLWHFEHCRIEQVAAITICYMLESDWIQHLTFHHCAMEDKSAKAIETALGKNRSLRSLRSLRTFQCIFRGRRIPLMNVCEMLRINHDNLVQLKLTLPPGRGEGCLLLRDMMHAVSATSRLECLSVTGSTLSLPSIDAILIMCFITKTLREIHFEHCAFLLDAMEFFVQTLSSHNILDTLGLEHIQLLKGTTDNDTLPSWNINFGKVQVQTLSLNGTKIAQETLYNMLTEISSNPWLKSLNLDGSEIRSNEFSQHVCNTLLVPNRGPSELNIGDVDRLSAALFVEALQQNTNLKSLSIGCFGDDTDLETFARGVATMTGLRKLTIYVSDEDEHLEEFFQALEHSLEQNTSLWTMALYGIETSENNSQRYMPRIRRWLAMNRVGRHSLMAATHVPIGVWPRVLSKSSEDADGIYFALTGKPDIVITPSRKRKERLASVKSLDLILIESPSILECMCDQH